MYECKILADSISGEGHRLTTFQVTFPRFILAEVNTHRMLSRNSASSRAIPTEKQIANVRSFPFIPNFNQRVQGMGVGEPLSILEQADAVMEWDHVREAALAAAANLCHVDKSRANRLLEPFMWHTAILSGTDWSNFFGLRTDANAQPEFRKIAEQMQLCFEQSEPRHLASGAWHLPLVSDEEMEEEAFLYADPHIDWHLWKKVSVGRCARVSYLTHDGKRDLNADVILYDRLKTNGHLSPFEHVARPFTPAEWDVINEFQDHLLNIGIDGDASPSFLGRLSHSLAYCGNFRGWHQARYDIPFQHDFSLQAHAVH